MIMAPLNVASGSGMGTSPKNLCAFISVFLSVSWIALEPQALAELSGHGWGENRQTLSQLVAAWDERWIGVKVWPETVVGQGRPFSLGVLDLEGKVDGAAGVRDGRCKPLGSTGRECSEGHGGGNGTIPIGLIDEDVTVA